jgi:hypothetical protein
MKKKLLAVVLSAAMALSLAGCMAEEINMDFQKDGSGSATVGVYLADEAIAAMGTTPEELFADQKDGTITKKTYDGKPYTGIVETQGFASVKELSDAMAETSEETNDATGFTFKESVEGKKKVLTVTIDVQASEPTEEDANTVEVSDEEAAAIEDMFHVTIDMTFPEGISRIDGNKDMYTINGNTAHIDLTATDEPQALTVVGILRDATAAEIKAAEVAKAVEAKFAATATYDGRFKDVPDDAWYKAALVRAYNIGSISGTSASTYSPSDHLTRAQVITMAARLRNIYDGDNEQFTAIAGQPWYAPYVEYAVKKGIVGKDKFSDYTADATRAEMAYVFANALPEECYAALGEGKTFSDVPATDSYYASIMRLANAGIVNGTGDGKYSPNDSVTRAQAAVFVARLTTPSTR